MSGKLAASIATFLTLVTGGLCSYLFNRPLLRLYLQVFLRFYLFLFACLPLSMIDLRLCFMLLPSTLFPLYVSLQLPLSVCLLSCVQADLSSPACTARCLTQTNLWLFLYLSATCPLSLLVLLLLPRTFRVVVSIRF